MNKSIVASMLVLGSMTVAAGQDRRPGRGPGPDPVVATLHQLLDTLANAMDVHANHVNQAAAANETPAEKAARSKQETAIAISTGAAIGSAVGAMVAKDDRAKGAALGGAVGGIAGLLFDRLHTKQDQRQRGPQSGAPLDDEPLPIPAPPEKKLF